MKYLPKLHQLKVFQTVIRYGSIRAAAREMKQSQPSLTRSMRELEDTLGAVLMTRGSRGIVLTEAGRAFAARMQLILEELERAADEIQQINQSSQGNIAVGFSSLPALTIFPPALVQFKSRFPKTNITVLEGQLSTLLPFLREGKLDFAIGTISPDVPLSEFIEEPLFKASFCIIARQGHPLEKCTNVAQLLEAKWFLPATSMGYYKGLESLFSNLYQALHHAPIRSDSVVTALNLILNFDYLTIVASAMLPALDINNRLCMLPITEPLPQASYSLIYPRQRPLTLAAKRFTEVLHWESQQHSWAKD
ncbi:LysR substrate-binding domain-containing protein [Pragia fontium]|uniref:LysR substrate-binding domain-containing protein n=1 Tax=Pragia fontium TaxID=82985 RepID=UPI000F70861D|nr:LysR substrate-binding domain-containing protein [Pragia fontium]VEJ53225.1 HTH-type transcriptional regulator AbgR [Pragia fontium]